MRSENEISFSPLDAACAKEIHAWPPYTGEFKPLDYALRSGGWLDAMPESPTTRRYAVRLDGRLTGFSILTDITAKAAEIYLAVKPGLTGKGIGGRLMELTLLNAFNELKLSRVYLKVRVWHKHAITLYEKVGFVTTGQKQEPIAGELVGFQIMELEAKNYRPCQQPV